MIKGGGGKVRKKEEKEGEEEKATCPLTVGPSSAAPPTLGPQSALCEPPVIAIIIIVIMLNLVRFPNPLAFGSGLGERTPKKAIF